MISNHSIRLISRLQRGGRGLIAFLLLSLACLPAKALQLTLNGVSKDKAIVSVNGKHRVLRKGQRNREGLLLISIGNNAATIEYQGRQREYRVGQSISTNYSVAKSRIRQTRITRTPNGMYVTEGRINGLPVRMMVDTGATIVAMNALEARRLGIDYRRIGQTGQVSTASGIETAYFVKLDSVDVGGIVVRDVLASVQDGSFPEVILLGMSYINQVNMHNEGNVLIFKQK